MSTRPARLPLVYSPYYDIPDWDLRHPFPMPKFRGLRQHLLKLGLARHGQFYVPDLAEAELLQRAHTASYVESIAKSELPSLAKRRLGLPLTALLNRRSRCAVAGTLLTAELALEHGLACNLAGGTHHAFADRGTGYCVFNDLAATTLQILHDDPEARVLIVDLDVHQGDGSATILADEPRAFTFSMHGESNFPRRKATSDRDVPMPRRCDDGRYLDVLRAELERLIAEFEPSLVLYDAGVDPHKDDRLGHLELTDEGLFERDRYVLESCVRQGIPVGTVIGGGYSKDLQALIERHALVFEAASRVYRDLVNQPQSDSKKPLI